MTTLANMTKEERANCVGMWGDIFIGYTGIIVYEDGKHAYLIFPEFNREGTFSLDKITPRTDLPRAWGPDGTPPAGEWEHINEPRFQNHKRRWVSNWEEE